MAQKDKYVLLKGKKHKNVFWSNNKDIDPDQYEILYTGNTSEEMVREWSKHHPYF
jgi:hypothetical protein